MSATNDTIKRSAPRAVTSLSAQEPPFPSIVDACPDLCRRFPELVNFDIAVKDWQEKKKNAVKS